MKHLLNSVMLFLLLIIGQNAWGQEVLASGDLTSTITWSVEQTGTDSYTLNITGYGDMPDYSGLKDMPWAKCQSAYGVTTNYNSMITELNIDSRITKIGRRTFVKAESITSVTIPENCVSIGQEAFKYCSNLKEIYIPSSVTSIGTDAFSNCRSLALIHYDGRCNANTGIAFSNVAAAGKIIEKSGTGASYANVPEGWEYYTHGEQCIRKAWVAENASGDKLFIYGQNPGARVNYAASGAVSNTDSPEYHPWRVNCWKYKSLEINRNVSVIESNELCGYSDNGVGKEGFASLETIIVESGNESFVVGEDGALYNTAMTSIRLYPVTNTATHIDIPSTITSIGSGAFYATKNLESVTFHANSLYFGQYSFARTSLNFIYFDTSQASLSWSATSFTGVAEEGVVAANGETNDFKNFTSMIGSGWTFDGETYGPVKTYISDGTLYVMGKGEYTTPSSDADWYDQKSSFWKIVVKENITNIGSYAFADCDNVTEVTLNNNGYIDYYAFKDCSALIRVNVGSGVTEFKGGNYNIDGSRFDACSFSGCSKLAIVNVTDLAKFCSVEGAKYLTGSGYGMTGEKTLRINGIGLSSTIELVIPEGVKEIKPYTLHFSNVTKIKFPSTLTEIAPYNFIGYTYLTEVTIPSTVSNVGIYAFCGCTALQTVTLNNTGIVYWGAFKDCSALTRVNIGGITGFKTAGYPNTGWHDYPFLGCSNLSTVNTTDLAAFCKIEKLECLTWGDSDYGTARKEPLMINGVAHASTDVLEIPEGVTYISEYAFRFFSNVKKIKLPEGIDTIPKYYFSKHSYLNEITIPSTVTYVGSNAFYNCTNLKRIICAAKTCPSTDSDYNSIAPNPDKITLIVPRGTASLYGATDMWKEFNIEEGKLESKYIDMKTSQQATLTVPTKALSWSLSDESIATLRGYAADHISRYVSSGTFVYDDTTKEPYKTVTVTADLDNCDVYVFNINVYPREVKLTDGTAYKNTEDFDVEKISYTRNFPEKIVGKWQCFYAPFDIEITDELLEDFDFAELYMVSYHDVNNNGEIEDGEPLRMTFSRLYAGKTLYANIPYYVRAKSSGQKTFEVTNTTLKAAANGSVNCSTTKHEYSLVGIYDTTNIKGCYTMGVSGGFSYYPNDKNINQYRWYMEVKSRTANGDELENDARPIEIVIDGEEEETTGIATFDDNASAPRNSKVFTLDGRQVNDVDNLPRGMYIINGKKVVKK